MADLAHRLNASLKRMTGYTITRAATQAGRDDRIHRLERRIQRLEQKVTRTEEPRRPSQKAFDAALARLADHPPERLSLTEIANLNGSDKGTLGPSPRRPGRNYTDVYEAFLRPLRNEPITILQVGLSVQGRARGARSAQGRDAGAASLRTWSDYFPSARVLGADADPAPHLDGDRVTTYVLDQGDSESLTALCESLGDLELDVVVDGGSHRPDHQQLTLGHLFPRLKPGGLYIIEDLLTNGKGDGPGNRVSADAVLNTRRVLKELVRYDTFGSPHLLVDEERLARDIAQMTFHVPRNPTRLDTEAVCVIRKSAGPRR